ncbi:MAG: NAD(P)H-dependent oxidoreductase [Streptosporangiaceae bacterium]
MVTIVGNPRPRSRTLALAADASLALGTALGARGIKLGQLRLVDLVTVLPSFLCGDGRVDELTETACGADVLVVASPTLRASYAGLLKLFLDLLPRNGLQGTLVVQLVTAAAERHRHAVEAHLKPVLTELGAVIPVPALSVLEADFPGAAELVTRWCESTAPVLAAALADGQAGPAPRSLADGQTTSHAVR